MKASQSESANGLMPLVDVPRLMSLGWDPEQRIWRLDCSPSPFSGAQCAIQGCRFEAASSLGLCSGCHRRWRAGGIPIDDFLRQPVERNRWHAERLCLVCRTPGHSRPALVDGICAACNGLRRSRHQTVSAFINGDERFPPAPPRRTIGTCVVAGCDRLSAFRLGLCHRHYKRWAKAGRPDLTSWPSNAASTGDGRATAICFAGVSHRFQAEMLFGIQTAVDEGRRLRASLLRRLLAEAQGERVDSLRDLLAVTTRGDCRRFIAATVAAIELATLTRDAVDSL
ncbi:MAG: hypothetical protein M3083_12650 [Actinomycetota bacterium]|nr:hypothetical protein [Actinomycetota bacterium]